MNFRWNGTHAHFFRRNEIRRNGLTLLRQMCEMQTKSAQYSIYTGHWNSTQNTIVVNMCTWIPGIGMTSFSHCLVLRQKLCSLGTGTIQKHFEIHETELLQPLSVTHMLWFTQERTRAYKSVQERAAWVRVSNYVKFETGRNLPRVLI